MSSINLKQLGIALVAFVGALYVAPALIPVVFTGIGSASGAVEGGCPIAAQTSLIVPLNRSATVIQGVTTATVCTASSSDVAINYNGAATTMSYAETLTTGDTFSGLYRIGFQIAPAFVLAWLAYKIAGGLGIGGGSRGGRRRRYF